MASGVPESRLTFAEIELAAEEFARENDFNPRRDDVRELVERLKGELAISHACNPETQSSGSMRACRDGMFKIFLSPFTGILRDNFTIAHELGHLRLHVSGYFETHPTENCVSVNRFGNDKPEWQANRFAAALLMPAKEFELFGEETDWDIPALSARFSVSQLAARCRANFLRR